jgi:CDP-paratose 2-epimerase
VFVTGAAGFLGTHVCHAFRQAGWAVVGLDNLSKFELERAGYDVDGARRHNLDLLKRDRVDFIKGDVTAVRHLPQADLIVHCAAQPAMTISIEQPVPDMRDNVLGTLAMLEMARRYEIPMASCSTVHMYGNAGNDDLVACNGRFQRHPAEIDEGQALLQGALTPLHASKRAAEIYVDAYRDTYGLHAANFRFTGMYGPNQFGSEDHGWVANFAIRAVTGRTITIFGTDLQVRDILYASDAAQVFLSWYHAGCPSGTYNVGGGIERAVSLGEVVDMLRGMVGRVETRTQPARHGDMHYFVCNYSRVMDETGWRPTVYPHQGLQHLVAWVGEHKELF